MENERFDGITLDVEPYLTENWLQDKKSIKTEFLTLLGKLKKRFNSQQDQALPIGCAVPFFYKEEGSFFEEILQSVDSVYLMTYFDSAAKIIEVADFYLESAKKSQRKVWITIETQDVVNMGQGGNRNTFFEEGWHFMEGELQKIGKSYEGFPAFGGISIHFYSSYRQMRKDKIKPQNLLRLEKVENKVTRIFSYPKTKPVEIDGNLDEWNFQSPQTFAEKENVVHGRPSWKNEEDLSFQVMSMWDEGNLYFAFKVQDDKLVVAHQGKDLWEGDHVELWLDLDLGKDFTEAVKSSDDIQFGFSPGNFANLKPEVTIWTPKEMIPMNGGIPIASVKTDNGYYLEIAIPQNLLYNNKTLPMSRTQVIYSPKMHTGKQLWYTRTQGSASPKGFFPGYRMGISIDGSDTDNPDRPQKCLLSTSLDRQWGNPTTFGILELRNNEDGYLTTSGTADGASELGKTFENGNSNSALQNAASQKTIEPNQTLPSGQSQESGSEISRNMGAGVSQDSFINLENIPNYPKKIEVATNEFLFGYRGKIGKFFFGASTVSASMDAHSYFDPAKDIIPNNSPTLLANPKAKSYRFDYKKEKIEDFCGGYVIITGDVSQYKSLTFLVKGARGGETFLVGMHDIISHKRGDAVLAGSIHRYLPNGIQKEWQAVTIPLDDFYGLDLNQIHALVFEFNEIGKGSVWIDAPQFSPKGLVNRKKDVHKKNFLAIDNFNHSDLNLLGLQASVYKKLPSTCQAKRIPVDTEEEGNKCLQLSYKKTFSGWCGYYSLLHKVDNTFWDLRDFQSLSFKVKGEKGTEHMEIGLADKSWIIIGDSLMAGEISGYLPKGLSTHWQEVTIPLSDFGSLDFSRIGSLVF